MVRVACRNPVVFFGLFLISTFFLIPDCHSADIKWRNHYLSEKGIYKGRGLPLFIVNYDLSLSAFGAQKYPEKMEPYTLFWGMYSSLEDKYRLNDSDGKKVPEKNEINIYSSIHRFVLTTPLKIVPKWTHFAQLVVPVVDIHVDSRFGGGKLEARTGGVGDILLGTGFLVPSVYRSDNITIDCLPYFDVYFPTGRYDKYHLSIGSNVFMFELGCTTNIYFDGIGDGLFQQLDLNLFVPTKNNDFVNPVTRNPSSDYHLAPSFQMNLKLAYTLSRHFKLGMGGFFDYQLWEDKMEGHTIKNSREVALGGGPILIGSFGRFFCDLGFFFDGEVENRPKGKKITLILYYTF